MNKMGRINKQWKKKFTRRQWLLRVGEAAFLTGLNGVIKSAETDTASALLTSNLGITVFPAGLYEPSTDHLGHALASNGVFHSIPFDSETDYTHKRVGPFQSRFFSSRDFEVVHRITELMLGKTPVTSNKTGEEETNDEEVSVEVAEWIDHIFASAVAVRNVAQGLGSKYRLLAIHHYGFAVVHDLETDNPEGICLEGMKWLATESSRRYGRAFLSLDEAQQVELLNAISDERVDRSIENAGTRFFGRMKHEIIRCFYTSRAGLSELDYKGNSYYVDSPGCDHSLNVHGPGGKEDIR